MAEDLRRFLDGRPVHARRVVPPERLWRWGLRNRALAAAIVTAALLLVAVAMVAGVGSLRTARLNDDFAGSLTVNECRGRVAELVRRLCRLRLRSTLFARNETFTVEKFSRLLPEPARTADARSFRRLLEASCVAPDEVLGEIRRLQEKLATAPRDVLRSSALPTQLYADPTSNPPVLRLDGVDLPVKKGLANFVRELDEEARVLSPEEVSEIPHVWGMNVRRDLKKASPEAAEFVKVSLGGKRLLKERPRDP